MKPLRFDLPWLLWAVMPLVASALVLLLAVAALPSLLLQPSPQLRREPDPGLGERLALARTARGGWILQGAPMPSEALARLLRSRPRGVAAVHFHPAGALSSVEVAASLAWLRQHSPLPVQLVPLGAAGVGL